MSEIKIAIANINTLLNYDTFLYLQLNFNLERRIYYLAQLQTTSNFKMYSDVSRFEIASPNPSLTLPSLFQK